MSKKRDFMTVCDSLKGKLSHSQSGAAVAFEPVHVQNDSFYKEIYQIRENRENRQLCKRVTRVCKCLISLIRIHVWEKTVITVTKKVEMPAVAMFEVCDSFFRTVTVIRGAFS